MRASFVDASLHIDSSQREAFLLLSTSSFGYSNVYLCYYFHVIDVLYSNRENFFADLADVQHQIQLVRDLTYSPIHCRNLNVFVIFNLSLVHHDTPLL